MSLIIRTDRAIGPYAVTEHSCTVNTTIGKVKMNIEYKPITMYNGDLVGEKEVLSYRINDAAPVYLDEEEQALADFEREQQAEYNAWQAEWEQERLADVYSYSANDDMPF